MSATQPLSVANTMLQQGKLDDAEQICIQVLQKDARSARAMHLLGIICHRRNRAKEGLRWMEKAVRVEPASADCQNGLGVLLGATGQSDLALAAFEKATSLRGDFAEAHSNLGTALAHLSRDEEAEAAIRRAIRFDPKYADAYFNLGNLLRKLGRVTEALSAYRDAIRVKPGFRAPVGNLAITLLRIGHADEATETYRRWLQKQPNDAEMHSNLLYVQHYLPEVSATDRFAEHLVWARLHTGNLPKQTGKFENVPDPNRRLRIGYISGDFREHPRARFIEPILAGHDRTQVEVFCYSDVKKRDVLTDRLKLLANTWREIGGQSDSAVADIIRRDRIDILVDCTGHMAGSRMLLLARKPAPVQVLYPGYPDTSGMKAIDYFLTDAYQDPPGTSEHLYTERLIRLPNYPRCYTPTHDVEVAAPVARDHPVFGAFNNAAKNSAPTLQTWARILQAAPTARLLVLCLEGTQSPLREQYVRQGLPADRLQFVTSRPREKYLELFSQIDVHLDPFPYNGYTTTLDSLWMGVPVVTLEGTSHVARAGVSLLSNAGHPELIAKTTEDYVRIAVNLATDSSRLNTLRSILRQEMRRSPLMNASALISSIEQAYRSMWTEWCGR